MLSTSNAPSGVRSFPRVIHFLLGTMIALASTSMPVAADAQIVFGAGARADFENFRDNFGDKHEDFSSHAVGTNLISQVFGLTFNTIKDLNNNPFPTPHHTEVVAPGLIMGARSASSGADGRYPFQVVFDNPQLRAGLRRPWNTSVTTAFYDSADQLLGLHQNTVGDEFVGYRADSDDMSTWVKRIEFNGTLLTGTRQVGQFGDLFYGTEAVPEPGSLSFVSLLASVVLFRRRRKRN